MEEQELGMYKVCVQIAEPRIMLRFTGDSGSWEKLKDIEQSCIETNLTSTVFTKMQPCKSVVQPLFRIFGES